MEARNWSAWVDLEPGAPRQLHVSGEVRVGTPRTKATLTARVPVGINPKNLILDLSIDLHGGSDVMSWVKTTPYVQTLKPEDFLPGSVEIWAEGKSLATVPVEEAH
jgi:hypothetical protein